MSNHTINKTGSIIPTHPCDDPTLDNRTKFYINKMEIDIPIPFQIIQIIYIIIFFIISLTLFYEIVAWVLYQKAVHKDMKKFNFTIKYILSKYHYHLVKLMTLFIASFLRFLWFLNPIYSWEDNRRNIYGSTFENHEQVTTVLLRIPQLLGFLVFFFQLKIWKRTVKNSRKLRKSPTARSVRNTSSRTSVLDFYDDSYCKKYIKSQDFLIDLSIIILILSGIISPIVNLHSSTHISIELYVYTIYVIVLAPLALYYSLKLNNMILKMRSWRKSPSGKYKNKKINSAVRKMERIKFAVYCMSVGVFIQIGTAIYRYIAIPTNLCEPKSERQTESIKYLVYVILVHFTEVIYFQALHYTLYMVRGRNKAARTVKYRNAKRKKMKQREVSGGNTIEDIGKKNVDHGLVTSTSTNDESLRNDTRIKSNSGVSDRSMLSTEEDDDISDVSSSSSSNSEDDPDEKQNGSNVVNPLANVRNLA